MVTKVALVGAGLFAHRAYLGALSRARAAGKSVAVTGCWSRSREKSGDLHAKLVEEWGKEGCLCFSGEEGLDKLLHSDEVDAVIVVLPPRPQLDITMRALEAGKHVLQEKPIGIDEGHIVSALERYDELGSSRPIWGLAENYRFEEVFARARDEVSELGPVIHCHLTAAMAMNAANPFFHSAWRHNADTCPGGYMFEGAVHLIAAIRYILHDSQAVPVTASAVSTQATQRLPQPDSLTGTLRFESPGGEAASGINCSLALTYAAALPEVRFQVICERGNVMVSRVEAGYELCVSTGQLGEERRQTFAFGGIDGEIEAFLSACELHASMAGKRRSTGLADQFHPRLSPHQGWRDAQVMMALLRSASTGHQQCV